MSTNPDQRGMAPRYQVGPASMIEAVADRLIALLEEFEAAIDEGRVPREFAKRLAKLRQTAEQLVDR